VRTPDAAPDKAAGGQFLPGQPVFYQSQTARITKAPAISPGTINQFAIDSVLRQRMVPIPFRFVIETARTIVGHLIALEQVTSPSAITLARRRQPTHERSIKQSVVFEPDRPLFPLIVALPRTLEKIGVVLPMAGPAEARRLCQRAQLILDLLTPKQSPITS
jgi:hypothetical protein